MQESAAKLAILLFWVDLEADKMLYDGFLAAVASCSECFAEMIFN